MTKDTLFDGFEPANTTPVPDVLFDMLLTRLSGAELKVLLYIIRRTWGFKKTTDAISLSQFENGIVTQEGKRLDYGVGLNRETICKALQSLEEKGYIESHKRTAHKRDKDVTVYSIRFKGEASVVGKSDQVGSRKSVLPEVVGKSDYGSRKSPKKVVGKSDPQETVLQDTVKQETEKSNSDDTTKHTVVSSDTTRALPGKTEEFLEKLREWRIEDERATTFEAYSFIVPTTYVEALAYLAPHGGVPAGYTDAQVLALAQKLYVEAHSQDEQVFTDEKPQGDDHAVPASGHSHRVGDTTASGDNPSHAAVDSGQVAAPEDRPVLETQEEIDKGDTQHGHRVPTLPAANPTASRERHVSRPGSDHSDHSAHPDNGLPVVRAVGSGTPGTQTGRDGRDRKNAERDAAQTLAETPTTPMPAQSLSLPPQAEQAAPGMTFVEARDYLRSLGYFLEPTPAMNGNWEIREPGERGFSVISGDEVRGIAEYQRKKREQAVPGQSPKGKGKKQAEPKPEMPKGPPVEPPADMAWGTRKCLMWFDFWRGGILIGRWKLMQASTCAKGLAEQFDEQTVIQARTDMEADPYYAAKGGCDVCDVANNIHKYLKKRQGKQQSAIQPALKVVKRYSSYDDPNFRSDQDFYPVEGGSYATASV